MQTTDRYTLYTNEQIRKIESAAYELSEFSPQKLMEEAGKVAFEFMMSNWQNVKKILIITGSGNNGGDGYVLAKYAKLAGIEVTILQVGLPGNSKEAKAAVLECQKLKIPILEKQLDHIFTEFDVIIDAMLGIGIKGKKLKPDIKDAIQFINKLNKPVLALDCPSGINTDTGKVIETAISATKTITFIGLKRGLFTGDARDYCGEVICHDLSLPAEIFDIAKSYIHSYSINFLKLFLPKRSKTAYKNNNGHVLIIGGNFGFPGAVKLAALGALRSGAGLVSVATQIGNSNGIIAGNPEIMVHEIKNKDDLLPLLEKATVIVLGPGLGQDSWAEGLFTAVITTNKPLIIDADGLNLLAQKQASLNIKKRSNWILTPHPGEAARLLTTTVAEIENNRFLAIEKLYDKYGSNIVLKGAGSLIIDSDREIRICNYGNPGMASGGMGDLLTGVISALVAQGVDLKKATIIGTYIHSYAADLASMQFGKIGLLASDLLPFIRQVMN
ncbi:MAG: NAD(P)H-hydrate dehydratase [Rickettsiaceae bacterium]|nr:NAD(P)H-hydrate dehydratase [Rickettsiaceae bacterium]